MSTTMSTSQRVVFATRKRLRPDDAFFIAGDKVALHDANNTQIFFYTEQEELEDYTSNEDDGLTKYSQYPCSAVYCNETFHTLEEYGAHYFSTLMLACGQCQAVLPNDYLLDLHLQEVHGSYFSSAVSKGKAAYRCLVSSCKESFPDDRSRQLHLLNVHSYPKWFRFHARGPTDDKISEGFGRQRKKWEERHRARVSHDASKLAADIGTCDERRQNQLEKKRARRDRQKKARAQIPCKFLSMEGGCWRGENCDFLHTDNTDIHDENEAKQSASGATWIQDMAMDIDGLANQLDQTIKLPDKITFGRRRRY